MAKKKKTKQGGQTFLSPEQYLRQKARTLEIGTCYVSKSIDEEKIGHVIVTRRHTGGRISVAFYLVDMACLGVKDSFYHLRLENYELEDMIDERKDMLRECSYEEAHNRIWGSIAYAEEAGIAPDKSFQLTQYMLEEDTDDVPLIEYEYGRDGKHFLTCHSELEASRYLPLMKKNLGEGNYHYIIGIGDPGFDDEDYDDDEEEYDELTTIHKLPVSHLNMADIVKTLSVETTRWMSRLMNLELEDIDDEDELQSRYTELILSDPEILLSRLPKKEIDILLYIYANHNKAKGVPTADTESILIMQLAGVADIYWNDDDERCIRVADDFLKVATPMAASVRISDKNRKRYEVESIICGMANLYGEVTLEDAKRGVMMAKGGFRSEAGRLIDEVIEHSLILITTLGKIDFSKTGLFADADDNLSFASVYGWDDPANLRDAIATYAAGGSEIVADASPMPTQPFTDDDARRFTTDEIIEAGKGDVPIIPNARQKVFWNFLTRELLWNDYYARRICFELWYKVNHADDPDNQEDKSIEQYFEDEMLSFDGITDKEREKGHRLLAEYLAHIPSWVLKGHAPAEMKRKDLQRNNI